MIRVTIRRSRRYRECGGCGGTIPAGATYRSCVATPGADYADPDHWSRLDMHAEGECFGGTGRQYDLAMDAEHAAWKASQRTTHNAEAVA